MNAAPNPEVDRLDRPVATLGDVLYAKLSRPPLPEAEWASLVQSIAGGDRSALHALYLRAHRVVFTLIMRVTHSRDTAEEITLDVFHDVWRRAAEYDPAGGSVLGWIMNQARRRALDRLRFEQRKKDGFVRNALMLLDPEERQAIETAFFTELTYVETAARLSAPVGTVKTRIRSGLSKLRQALNQPP